MDYLFALRVFVLVAETGNMTYAGNMIFLTQPAVSMQIKTLEEFYGTKLFLRTPTGLVLTDNGKKVYHYAKEILRNFEELGHQLKVSLDLARSKRQREIRIASCIFINEMYMSSILHHYMKQCPDVNLTCTVMDFAHIIKALLQSDLDVGLVGFRDKDGTESTKLQFDLFLREELGIILPRDYLKDGEMETRMEALTQMNLITLKSECGITCLFQKLLKKYHLSIKNFKVKATFCSPNAVKQSVLQGFGWSILPVNFVRDELHRQIVWKADLKGNRIPLQRPLFLVYMKSQEEIDEVKLFLDTVRSGNWNATNEFVALSPPP